jgi:gas vesicle protein
MMADVPTSDAARGGSAPAPETPGVIARAGQAAGAVADATARAAGSTVRRSSAAATAARDWLSRTRDRTRDRNGDALHDADGATNGRGARRRRGRDRGAAGAAGAERSGTDWQRAGVFGAGLAIGVLLGAGAALLAAPASGFETRTRLARSARRAGDRVVDRWDDLATDVGRSAKRGARAARRKLVMGRWAAEDAWQDRAVRRSRVARDVRA